LPITDLNHGFSKCGGRITTGTPTIVDWQAALKNQIYIY